MDVSASTALAAVNMLAATDSGGLAAPRMTAILGTARDLEVMPLERTNWPAYLYVASVEVKIEHRAGSWTVKQGSDSMASRLIAVPPSHAPEQS